MDLAPGLLGDDLVISRDPGLNAAQWNMHERQLSTQAGRYLMDGRPLVFYHHTSFDPFHPERLAQRQSKFTLENKPEYGPMMGRMPRNCSQTGTRSARPGRTPLRRLRNGVKIFHFQRRLFRQLLAQESVESDPFSTGPDSFYALLERNGLVVFERERSEFVQADFRSSRGAGAVVEVVPRATQTDHRHQALLPPHAMVLQQLAPGGPDVPAEEGVVVSPIGAGKRES